MIEIHGVTKRLSPDFTLRVPALKIGDGELNGLQLGIGNAATEVHGCQIGVVNYAQSLNGLQLGLLNFAKSNAMCKFFPFFNVGF